MLAEWKEPMTRARAARVHCPNIPFPVEAFAVYGFTLLEHLPASGCATFAATPPALPGVGSQTPHAGGLSKFTSGVHMYAAARPNRVSVWSFILARPRRASRSMVESPAKVFSNGSRFRNASR
jgi:hypothetical protein